MTINTFTNVADVTAFLKRASEEYHERNKACKNSKTGLSNAKLAYDDDVYSGEYNYVGNVLTTASFQTNGKQGGDGGHGGFLQIELESHNYPLASVIVEDYEGNKYENDDTSKVSLRFSGDCEMRAALESLEFIVSNIRKHINHE